jgi:hypothetical protein
MMFPRIQIGIACEASTFRREAARRPPRSSRIGIMEIRKMIPFAEIYADKFAVNH